MKTTALAASILFFLAACGEHANDEDATESDESSMYGTGAGSEEKFDRNAGWTPTTRNMNTAIVKNSKIGSSENYVWLPKGDSLFQYRKDQYASIYNGISMISMRAQLEPKTIRATANQVVISIYGQKDSSFWRGAKTLSEKMSGSKDIKVENDSFSDTAPKITLTFHHEFEEEEAEPIKYSSRGTPLTVTGSKFERKKTPVVHGWSSGSALATMVTAITESFFLPEATALAMYKDLGIKKLSGDSHETHLSLLTYAIESGNDERAKVDAARVARQTEARRAAEALEAKAAEAEVSSDEEEVVETVSDRTIGSTGAVPPSPVPTPPVASPPIPVPATPAPAAVEEPLPLLTRESMNKLPKVYGKKRPDQQLTGETIDLQGYRYQITKLTYVFDDPSVYRGGEYHLAAMLGFGGFAATENYAIEPTRHNGITFTWDMATSSKDVEVHLTLVRTAVLPRTAQPSNDVERVRYSPPTTRVSTASTVAAGSVTSGPMSGIIKDMHGQGPDIEKLFINGDINGIERAYRNGSLKLPYTMEYNTLLLVGGGREHHRKPFRLLLRTT